ncbi:coproporphyrinogen III oxidase [Spirochaetia bacterium]|nr:coproporphyrinogen III oxidase [Spirochaetia bacterium]
MGNCSLYIHIPFCASFCDYCDFYSVRLPSDSKTADRLINAYIDALLAEGERLVQKFGAAINTTGAAINTPGAAIHTAGAVPVPSVYIGGGTPSMLGAAGIGRLLRGLAAVLPSTPRQKPPEFTVEANPESADGAFLGACRDNGVNRISLGVQSFCDHSRRLVHRGGEAARIPERLRLVSEIFGGNFSADLIAGLPAQDEAALLGDIEKLLSYHPAHVSLYSLTVEEGTPLAEARTAGGHCGGVACGGTELLPPAGSFAGSSADETDRLWIAGRDALEQAGYGQYEVSNFALPGKRSTHNIRYWRMENWLGLGAAASGSIFDDEAGTGRRFTYPADIGPWVNRKPGEAIPVDAEELDRLTLMKETFLMGFRYIEGPDPALFEKRFGVTIERALPETLAKWQGRGLLQAEKIALSKEGLLLLDPFLIDAFGELERREAGPAGKSPGN